jgi:hypothetical protein
MKLEEESSCSSTSATTGSKPSMAMKRKNKDHKEFDFYSYRQRYITLHIAYVGNDYHGFALQNHMEYQHQPSIKMSDTARRQETNRGIDDDSDDTASTSSSTGTGTGTGNMNRGLITVESELFTALLQTRLLLDSRSSTCKYNRCGRTDKGVSAFNQVVALNVRSAFKRDEMIPADVDMTGTYTQRLYTIIYHTDTH